MLCFVLCCILHGHTGLRRLEIAADAQIREFHANPSSAPHPGHSYSSEASSQAQNVRIRESLRGSDRSDGSYERRANSSYGQERYDSYGGRTKKAQQALIAEQQRRTTQTTSPEMFSYSFSSSFEWGGQTYTPTPEPTPCCTCNPPNGTCCACPTPGPTSQPTPTLASTPGQSPKMID